MSLSTLSLVNLVLIYAPLAHSPVFYAPLDGDARAVLAPYHAGTKAAGEFEAVDGMVGKAVSAETLPLDYDLAGLLTKEKGTLAAWVRVPWAVDDGKTHVIFDLGRFGMLRRWTRQRYVTFTLWYHHLDEKHDYGCTHSIESWRPGQWHHIAIAWSWPDKQRALYFDGEPVKKQPVKRVPNVLTRFRIGPELSAVDEVYAFSEMLSDSEVRRIFQAGKAGRPAFDLGPLPPPLGAIGMLPDEPRPARPAFVNWSFDRAWQRANAYRAEVTLNGWWRWQRADNAFKPPVADRWLYRKQPALSHYGQAFPLRDDQERVVAETDPRTGGNTKIKRAHVWCEREFAPPLDWRGRRIALEVDSIVKGGAIYFNGQLLDCLPKVSLGGTYDVTERIAWDKPNRLTIRCHGIDGDLALRCTPAARIDDAWLKTSFRRKRVECELTVTADRPCTAVVQITDPSTGQIVKTLEANVPAGKAQTVVAAAPWLAEKLWSMDEPYLYTFTAKLVAGGRTLDQTFPRRFGFRELWIERDQFLLNGVPTHFIGHSNAHTTTTAELACRDYLRYSFERWKAAGLNCVTPWQGTGRNPTFSHLLDVSDEVGMGIFGTFGLPSFERVLLTDETRAQYAKVYRRYIRRYRQHPSLLAWMIGSGSHVFDFCPGVMDNSFDPDSVPDWDRPKRLRMGFELADRFDPTRIKFGLSEGNIGPVWTSMAYQGFDVELRERRNWPWAWDKVRHKPLMPCEFSLPYYRDWFMRTQRRSGRAQYSPRGTHTLATEYAAMYFGERAYGWDDENYLKSLAASPGSPYNARSCWETKNLFADTLLSWRTYGISFVYHAEVPSLFTGSRPKFPTDPNIDPRRPGGAPECLGGSLQAADELSEFGQRVKAATEPVVAYIAGPDRKFNYTDHCYFAGQTVRKAAVVLNYRIKPLDYRLEWRALDTQGQTVAKGEAQGRLAPGARSLQACKIEFDAPAVNRRTDVRIVLDMAADVKRRHEFTVTVFPPAAHTRAKTNPPAILFDPVGDTRAVLKKAGVETEPLGDSLAPDRMLVIGRHALEKAEWRKQLDRAGFDNAVAGGLRVLVFEQAASEWEGNVLGLKIRDTSTRHAFIRAPGHPCLDGLEPGGLHFLRGDSDLVPAWAKPKQVLTSYPLHWWHWGNDNIVATYVIEKPQVGAVRALVDCGFDLSEAALLETARGRGTMLFCQLDVTNRYRVDPVATRLVDNMIGYLMSLHPRTPKGDDPADLAKRIPLGGTIDAYRSPTPPVPGLCASDTFFREKLTLPAFDPQSAAPLFAQARGQWATSLSLAALHTNWQKAKLARIEAALRFANAAAADAGPQLACQGDGAALYPIDWRYVESINGSFDPYVYWRW